MSSFFLFYSFLQELTHKDISEEEGIFAAMLDEFKWAKSLYINAAGWRSRWDWAEVSGVGPLSDTPCDLNIGPFSACPCLLTTFSSPKCSGVQANGMACDVLAEYLSLAFLFQLCVPWKIFVFSRQAKTFGDNEEKVDV